jgi:sulfur carrier protein ThiS
MQNEIELTVNGDVRRLPVGATVESLIGSLGLDRRKLAVERNREIVPLMLLRDCAIRIRSRSCILSEGVEVGR